MLNQILNPDIFHGTKKKGPFFEGWYFKITSDHGYSFAFIPGVFTSPKIENSFSFIQVLHGNKHFMNLVKFPYSDFSASERIFNLKIAENQFSNERIGLNIKTSSLEVRGELIINNIKKWPDSVINPGSMGFYNYLTFMQCYSQVCAMSGDIAGSILINGEEHTFSNGKIYIEKNWGKAFPYSYIWAQCNNFQKDNLSVTCSIGHVPMPTGSFTGFLIGLYFENNFIKFTTINRSSLQLDFSKSTITITTANRKYVLILQCSYKEEEFVMLYAPSEDSMVPIAKETITGILKLTLKDKSTNLTLVEALGTSAGIEFSGNYTSLR